MTTPGSQAGQTAADSGSVPASADQGTAPDLASRYDSAQDYADGGYDYAAGAVADDYGADLPPGWPGAHEPRAWPDAPPDVPGEYEPDDAAEVFPADSQAGAGWAASDLAEYEQAAGADTIGPEAPAPDTTGPDTTGPEAAGPGSAGPGGAGPGDPGQHGGGTSRAPARRRA